MAGLIEMKCPCCGVVYGLERDFYNYRQNGGMINGEKADWYCPNGHNLIFTDSRADKLRRERDRLKQQLAEKDDTIRAERERVERLERSRSAIKGQVTRLKTRAKNGVCPCCNRSFKNLARHMKSQHPEFDPTGTDETAT